MTNLESVLKSRDFTLPTEVHIVKAMVFPIVMYGCENWTIKKPEIIDAFELWCWRRLLRIPYCKELKPANPKGNQTWIFIERTDTEAEAPILWPHDVKNWLIGKDPDARKDWSREEKAMREDEVIGWHHCLSGHEFEQAPGNGEGQASLVCCSPWGHKKSDTTEWLNNKKWSSEHRESLSGPTVSAIGLLLILKPLSFQLLFFFSNRGNYSKNMSF